MLSLMLRSSFREERFLTICPAYKKNTQERRLMLMLVLAVMITAAIMLFYAHQHRALVRRRCGVMDEFYSRRLRFFFEARLLVNRSGDIMAVTCSRVRRPDFTTMSAMLAFVAKASLANLLAGP